MLDDLKKSIDEFSRQKKAKNDAKGRTENDRQWAESVCQRKINQLVCKVIEDYNGRGKVTTSEQANLHLGYKVCFSVSQTYNKYGVASQTKKYYYGTGYSGTIDTDTHTVNLTRDMEEGNYTSFNVEQQGSGTIENHVFIRVTDCSEEVATLERQISSEPLSFLEVTKEKKDFYEKNRNPRKEKKWFVPRNLFQLFLGVFLTLALIFSIGIYGSRRVPLYDEKFLSMLIPEISDFFNRTIYLAFVFYGLAVVSFILCCVLNGKLNCDMPKTLILEMIIGIALPVFFLLSLIYAKGDPGVINLGQIVYEKTGLYLQLIFFIPDLLLGILCLIVKWIYYAWTVIRPISIILLLISIIISFVVLIRNKEYKAAVEEYLLDLGSYDKRLEWKKNNYKRVTELLNKFNSHLIKYDEGYYQRYLDTL